MTSSSINRPKILSWAVALLLVCLLFDGANIIKDLIDAASLPQISDVVNSGFTRLIQAGGKILIVAWLMFRAFLIYKVWVGKSWARTIILIIFIINILLSVFAWWALLRLRSEVTPRTYLDLITSGISLIAIFLLFKQASSKWFRAVALRVATKAAG
jgi:hypothetical protein